MVATTGGCFSTLLPGAPALPSTSLQRYLVEPLVIGGPVGGACRGFEGCVQYRGVYPHAGGWRGKVKFFDRQCNLPTQPTALLAAVTLAQWWECRLGPQWAASLYRHGWVRGGPGRDGGRIWMDAPWRILRDRERQRRVKWVTAPACGERSNVDGLFYTFGQRMRVRTEPCRVVAWIRGVRTEVPGRWDWRRDAAHGLFAWLEKTYGPHAPPLLWFPEDNPSSHAKPHDATA